MPSALVDISFGDADCTSVEGAMETIVRQGDPDDAAVPRHHACLLGTEKRPKFFSDDGRLSERAQRTTSQRHS